MAAVRRPIFLAVRMMRAAISPRLAMRIVRVSAIAMRLYSQNRLGPRRLAFFHEGANAFLGFPRQCGGETVRGLIEGRPSRLASGGANEPLGLGDGGGGTAQALVCGRRGLVPQLGPPIPHALPPGHAARLPRPS